MARSLIESQFPGLAAAWVELVGEGWDNTAYLINGEFVFRFPRREIAAPLLEAESRLLPLIAPRVPLRVPIPIYLGRPSQGYPWSFAGYRKLPGRAASEVELSAEERTRLAEPLARFLKALHSIPIDAAREKGAEGDLIGRLDLEKRVPLARKLLERLTPTLDGNTDHLEAILNSVAVDDRPRADTLVHGDLYSRHILVDDEHNPCGVIDWGDCHIGDRAVDLLPVFTMLHPRARETFFDIYGSIDESAARIARARALYHTLVVFNYAREILDNGLEREARYGLSSLAL